MVMRHDGVRRPRKLAEVFYVNAGCFIQFYAVQRYTMFNKVGLELIPDANCEVLGTRKLAGHKWHIQVKVFVVHMLHQLVFHNVAKLFGIENEAGFGVGSTFYRDVEFVVVAVPVLIGAFAKNLAVAILTPSGVEQPMGRIEMFYSSEVYHGDVFGQI